LLWAILEITITLPLPLTLTRSLTIMPTAIFKAGQYQSCLKNLIVKTFGNVKMFCALFEKYLCFKTTKYILYLKPRIGGLEVIRRS
jgi:hypothetical protein